MTALRWGGSPRGGGIELKGKRTHGPGKQCGDCRERGRKGDEW